MTLAESELDVADLNDWLLFEHPQVYEAIKYLHLDPFVQCAIEVWKLNGCPDIREFNG